jgi:deoxyribonuclease V
LDLKLTRYLSTGLHLLGEGGTATTDNILIACVDVDYRNSGALAAGLWFRGWQAAMAEFEAIASFPEVAEYEPGAFYRRELPCLLNLLTRGPRADLVLVDGYVWLGDGVPGLGAHLHSAIGGVVVGIAKTRFATATDAIPICRGSSRSPLFVSAVGMPTKDAAEKVATMHGPYRLPTLVKQVDALARSSRPVDEPNVAEHRSRSVFPDSPQNAGG